MLLIEYGYICNVTVIYCNCLHSNTYPMEIVDKSKIYEVFASIYFISEIQITPALLCFIKL
jgi:hypothetical protein